MINIALAQINACVGDFAGNLTKIKNNVQKAFLDNAQLIIFPELSISGYIPEDWLFHADFLAQAKESLEALVTYSQAFQTLTIIVGCPLEIDGKLYNCGVVIRAGEILACHRKMKLPHTQVFDEYRYFHPGVDATVFDLAGEKIGLLVCEDVWHPEPALAARSAGAQSLVVINASPYYQGKLAKRERVISNRIQETGLPLLYVNMVGAQDEIAFDGTSLVYNKDGGLIYQGSQFEEGLAYVELDHHLFTTCQPSMQRLPLAGEIYKALVCGLRDYVHKNGFTNVILGLSGGVDSALVLTIAVDAFGADHVKAYMLPSQYTAEISLVDAQRLANNLRVRLETLPIDGSFASLKETLAKPFAGRQEDLTEENLQARIRGVILMALSNKFNSLLLTTGNKSEMAVGYCTLYGDMMGAYSVIKDVYKTQVYELCQWRNDQALVIPKRILTRAPSAELRENQTDQDSLPTYDVLDGILRPFIEENKTRAEIVALGYDEATVAKVLKMVKNSEYKRKQSALGTKVTQRAFGRDWRYPLSNRFLP